MLKTLVTIVVMSAADRVDSMPITEVVVMLTMVPPAVDALEPVNGLFSLRRGRSRHGRRDKRAAARGDHKVVELAITPLMGLGL